MEKVNIVIIIAYYEKKENKKNINFFLILKFYK